MSSIVAALECEGSIQNVSERNRQIRQKLADALRTLPVEAFARLRHLQPQVGCFNRCSFCSQGAGTVIWQLDSDGLANFFAALKTVALEVATRFVDTSGRPYVSSSVRLSPEGVFPPGFQMPHSGLLGYARSNHRPGVIYAYLDNDISVYPFLDRFCQYAWEDLGVRVRISTVGYSRHNQTLQGMHERINTSLLDSLGGVRFSFTPYTYGWTPQGARSGLTSREEFIDDFANLLRTYRPAVRHLGTGNRAVCVELRFRPLVVKNVPVTERIISGRHVIHIGPYLLISAHNHPHLQKARISDLQSRTMRFDTNPVDYSMLLSSDLVDCKEWESFASSFIESQGYVSNEILHRYIIRQSKVYLLENDDGPYYAVDPNWSEYGFFAKHFYPVTSRRPMPGYIDSERYFLNMLLAYKLQKGLSRRAPFPHATWDEAKQVLVDLASYAECLRGIYPAGLEYIREQVLPLVTGYADALEKAGYTASYFFDRGFTIDTGDICNLGSGFHEYRGLASREDLPLTPQHERTYGRHGSLAVEGNVWRMAITPTPSLHGLEQDRKAAIGKRNIATTQPMLLVEELDLARTSSANGQVINQWLLSLAGVERVSFKEQKAAYLIPGQLPNLTTSIT